MRESGLIANLRLRVRAFRLRRRRRRAIAQGHAHPLTMASPGARLRVVGVAGEHSFEIPACFRGEFGLDPDVRRRLMEMGLVPGAEVQILRAGDPTILALWGGRTALSRSLAQSVFVAPSSAAARTPREAWAVERAA